MVWNKTPDNIVNEIIQALQDPSISYEAVSKRLGVPKATVGNFARKFLSNTKLEERYSWWNRELKRGAQNPMRGRVGFAHHAAKEEVRVSGYKTVFKPEWWEGGIVKSGRIYEHHFSWAKANNMRRIPNGCVVHHIDFDINNNCPTNLILMSISDHMKLHGELRKVQRLSRKRVGDSVPEAQSIL